MSKSVAKNRPGITKPSGPKIATVKKFIHPLQKMGGLIVAIIALLLYANTLLHEYAVDDVGAIIENRYVKEGFAGIPKLLKVDFWHFSNVHLGYYRPLSLISFAIEYEFLKDNPHFSHLVNVLLFAFSGYMLFLVLSKIFQHFHPVFAFAVSLLYVAHPIHTEIVANIKGRDELLSYLNIVLMLWWVIRYCDQPKVPYLLTSLGFGYLAMLSKETALTGILLVPLVFFYYKNLNILDSLKKAAPFALVIGLFFIQKWKLLGTLSAVIPSDIVNYPYTDGSIKFPTVFLLFGFCLRLLMFPHPLRYDYSFNQIPAAHWNHPFALLGLVLFIVGAVFAVKELLKKSTWGFVLSMFYITLIPALAFTVLRGGIFAERFLFIPSLAFCIALVYVLHLLLKVDLISAGATLLQKIRATPVLSGMLAVIFLLYSLKTVSRNADWKNNLTLFSADIKTGVNSAQNQRHYGDQLIYAASVEKDTVQKKQCLEKGLKALKESIRIHPKFGESYSKIGIVYQLLLPNTDSAIYYYNKAIETAPGYAISYYNLGTVYQGMGKYNIASYLYNEAVKQNPEYQEAKKASEDLKKATGLDVHVNPFTSMVDTNTTNKDTYYYYNLGNYYASQGDYQRAAQSFTRSIALDPTNENSIINLANCYGMLGQYQISIATAQKLLDRNPNNLRALENIAFTYKLMGNMQKHEEYIERANAVRK